MRRLRNVSAFAAMLAALVALAMPFASCHRSGADERIAERQAESERLYQAGFTLMMERRYETARDTFEKAVRADETNAQAWYDLSFVLMSLGQYAKAVRAAQQAAAWYEHAALHDDKIAFRNDALVQAGEAYLWGKKPKKAAAQFQAVFDLNPADYDTLLNIVVTYIRCERAEEAAQFCEKNIASHTDPAALAPLYLLYAECQYALGDEDTALRALERANEAATKAALADYAERIARLHTIITDESPDSADSAENSF